MVLALLVGRFTGKPEGVTKEDVNMKNINNKNIKSVIEAMLKAGSTLFRACKSMISGVLVAGQ